MTRLKDKPFSFWFCPGVPTVHEMGDSLFIQISRSNLTPAFDMPGLGVLVLWLLLLVVFFPRKGDALRSEMILSRAEFPSVKEI